MRHEGSLVNSLACTDNGLPTFRPVHRVWTQTSGEEHTFGLPKAMRDRSPSSMRRSLTTTVFRAGTPALILFLWGDGGNMICREYLKID